MTVHYESASYRKQIMRLLRVQSILGSNGCKKSLEVMTVSNDYAIISDKKTPIYIFLYPPELFADLHKDCSKYIRDKVDSDNV